MVEPIHIKGKRLKIRGSFAYKILFSSLQLKFFDIAQKDAKHKKLLNLLRIVYLAIPSRQRLTLV